MKAAGFKHPKTNKLMRLLKIKRREAVGLMEMLWQFAAQYAQAGDIGKFDDDEIATAVEWEGEPTELIEALVDCGSIEKTGFLARHPEHRLIIHDWHDHAPEYLKKLDKKGTICFVTRTENGGKIPDKKEPTEGDGNFLPESSGIFQNKTALPSLTIPSLSSPSQAIPCPPEADADGTRPGESVSGENGSDPAAAAGTSPPPERGASQGKPSAAKGAPSQGAAPRDPADPGGGIRPPSAGGSGEGADPQWQITRGRLFQELSTVLKLNPRATNPEAQDSYMRATQAIIAMLDAVHTDAVTKGKRWGSIEKQLRSLARSSRKKGKYPPALWLHKCQEAFGVGGA